MAYFQRERPRIPGTLTMRIYNCCDNAVAESFWGTLADEMDFDTRVEARRAIFEYIESFYNLHRRHSSIGYRSPRDHELSFNAVALSA